MAAPSFLFWRSPVLAAIVHTTGALAQLSISLIPKLNMGYEEQLMIAPVIASHECRHWAAQERVFQTNPCSMQYEPALGFTSRNLTISAHTPRAKAHSSMLDDGKSHALNTAS